MIIVVSSPQIVYAVFALIFPSCVFLVTTNVMGSHTTDGVVAVKYIFVI